VPRASQRLTHNLDRPTFVNPAEAARGPAEVDKPVEDSPGLDPALENLRKQLLNIGASRSRPAVNPYVPVERWLRSWSRSVVGNAHTANRAARPRDIHRREHRVARADALEDGVDAEGSRQFSDSRKRLCSTFAHDT